MLTKVCTRCSQTKELEQFPPQKAGKYGRAARCKTCLNAQNLIDRAAKRALKRGPVAMTSRNHTGTLATNHTCTHCSQSLSRSRFQIINAKPSGWCHDCRNEHEKQKRVAAGGARRNLSAVDGTRKLCTCCGTWKEMIEFFPARRGRGGVSAACKECRNEKKRTDEGRAYQRQKVAEFRARHPERHKAAHRLHQFKRRMQKEAQSDGTVTDEFLIQLYATCDCFYCAKSTPESKRTAEHRQPLNKGGLHSIHNLAMACLSCNAAKRDLTEAEFRKLRNL